MPLLSDSESWRTNWQAASAEGEPAHFVSCAMIITSFPENNNKTTAKVSEVFVASKSQFFRLSVCTHSTSRPLLFLGRVHPECWRVVAFEGKPCGAKIGRDTPQVQRRSSKTLPKIEISGLQIAWKRRGAKLCLIFFFLKVWLFLT